MCKIARDNNCNADTDCFNADLCDPFDTVCESRDVCGNGVVETGESCDDGHHHKTHPFQPHHFHKHHVTHTPYQMDHIDRH